MVQAEFERRSRIGGSFSANTIFASKLMCYDCGGFYGRKVWHSGTPYAKVMYRCNCKTTKKGYDCKTPSLTENEVKASFVKAYNLAMQDKERIIEDTKEVIKMLSDTTEIDKKIIALNEELEVVSQLADNFQRNSSLKKEEYALKHNELMERYNKANGSLTLAQKDRVLKIGKGKALEGFVAHIQASPGGLVEFDDELFVLLIEHGTVNHDRTITFKFKNGTEVTA